MFGKKEQKLTGRVDTLIAESARIVGDVQFQGGLHLDGKVHGNIMSEGGQKATLWVSEKGEVEGNLEVPTVIVNGLVRGDVIAREKLVLGTKARINGNVTYGAMEMAQGAEVTGKLSPLNPPPGAQGGGSSGLTAGTVALKAVPSTDFDARRSAS